MTPPPSLRRRIEAQASAANAKGGRSGKTAASERSMRVPVLIGVSVAVGGFLWMGARRGGTVGNGNKLDAAISPEAARLIAEADQAVRQSFDYPQALELAEKAAALAPDNAGVLHFHASILLGLGHVVRAWHILREVFLSSSEITRDGSFLQQYVLSLHRLGKKAELEEVWPRIAATPGIHWRSPLQCPDRVDESVLDGAVPFPDPAGLRVAEQMTLHRDAILAEFNKFWAGPGAKELKFKANQDNDLVFGNKTNQWTELLLFDKGYWDPRACAAFPTACKVLSGNLDVEGVVHGKRAGQVSLLRLEAGARLVPHFGSVNWRYTAQMGLLVPDNVVIHVGGEQRTFQQGEVLVLDDSFLHSVTHDGDGPRITLYATFFHPATKPMSHWDWMDRRAEAGGES